MCKYRKGVDIKHHQNVIVNVTLENNIRLRYYFRNNVPSKMYFNEKNK